MSRHKAVGRPKVGKLGLEGLSRHLVDHGSLAVNYLVVGEHQNKVLAVGVNHAERQLAVVVAAEVGIALHISQEVVHPAHVPLIIKAQAVLLYVSRHLGPGCGLLGNQNRAVLSALKYGIQVL